MTKLQLPTHSVEIVPAFHDIDLLEVVWHGHYVRYFEQARTALLARHGYDFPDMAHSGYAWPVIDLSIRYSKPARYGSTLLVTASVIEWQHRLKIGYRIHDLDSGQLLTKGSTVQVAVDLKTREMCFVSPDVLFEKLALPKP